METRDLCVSILRVSASRIRLSHIVSLLMQGIGTGAQRCRGGGIGAQQRWGGGKAAARRGDDA
jgi:hypothetical protein